MLHEQNRSRCTPTWPICHFIQIYNFYGSYIWHLYFDISLISLKFAGGIPANYTQGRHGRFLAGKDTMAHTGSFAQNSFQIDSINSCSTSKNLLFWLKMVKIIYFLTLKPIKGKLGFILKIMKKMLGGATSQKSQKEM